jgi:hypothetical protein
LDGAHHLVVCVNLWGKNLDIVKKNTEALLVVGEYVGLEVNAGKTKYVSMFCEWNAGLNHNIHTANKSLKMLQSSNTAEFLESSTHMAGQMLDYQILQIT